MGFALYAKHARASVVYIFQSQNISVSVIYSLVLCRSLSSLSLSRYNVLSGGMRASWAKYHAVLWPWRGVCKCWTHEYAGPGATLREGCVLCDAARIDMGASQYTPVEYRQRNTYYTRHHAHLCTIRKHVARSRGADGTRKVSACE